MKKTLLALVAILAVVPVSVMAHHSFAAEYDGSKPLELVGVINKVDSNVSPEIPYAYHILYTFAHVFHLRQRKVLSDNEWTGWLRWMNSAFQQGKIKEIWQSSIEMEKWFDPAFQEFVDKELIPAGKR